MNSVKAKDHLGNEFNSLKEMCEHWGVRYRNFFYHFSHGKPIKDCLLFDVHHREVFDHKGNKFSSIASMCKFYNVTYNAYTQRMRNGWTLEKALTTKAYSHYRTITDHKGNTFKSVTTMCEYWNITPNMYYERIKKFSLEKTLTKKPRYYD